MGKIRIFSAVLMLSVFFSGCTKCTEVPKAMALRTKLSQSEQCRFHCRITADYGTEVYEFGLACTMNQQGNLTFHIQSPQSIQGISGEISGQKGIITFEDQMVAFPMLAEGQITPVTGPWVLLKALRSGYIKGEGGGKIIVDDSYQEGALQIQVQLDKNDLPLEGEILYKGLRIITVSFDSFSFL